MIDPNREKSVASASFARGILLLTGGATATFGLLALLGWALGIPRLAGLQSGMIPMAPSTAMLFVLFGLAVGLRSRPLWEGPLFRGSNVLVGLVALAALGLFVPACQNLQWDGEHLAFTITGQLDGMPLGHMSPVTALCFLLGSLSFFLSSVPSASRRGRPVPALGTAALLLGISFTSLLCHLFGVPLFSGATLIQPALSTMLAFMTLSLALVILAARPESANPGSPGTPARFLVLYVLLGSGIIAGGCAYYRGFEQHFRRDAEGRLTSIAELKADELVRWRNERLADGNIFFENPAFSARVRRLFATPTDERARSQLQTWIGKVQQQGHYDQFRLLDSQGVTRLSMPEGLLPPSAIIAQAAAAALRSGRPVLQDFYRHDHNGRVFLAVVVPVSDDEEGGPPLGVLVLRIDPSRNLYPVIQRWPEPSETAEVALVGRDGDHAVALNALRFRPDSALTQTVSLARTEVPGVRAVLGETGFMIGTDYRGHPILAAVLPVRESPWHLVVKMDRTEADAPLRERMWGTGLFVGVLLLSLGTGLSLIWRRERARFFQERFETEKALRESESRFRLVLETMSLIGVVLDTEGRITLCNDFVLGLTGWKRAEVMGRNWFELFLPPEIRDGIERKIFLESGAAGAIPLHFENEIVTRDGGRRLVAWNNTVLRDIHGVVIGVASIGEDITERKAAEAAVRESEQRFRDLVDSTDGIVWEADATTFDFTYVSKNAERILGYPAGDWMRRDFWVSHVLAEDRERAVQYCLACTGRLENHEFEYRFVAQDGKLVWLRDIVKVVGENGKPRWLRGLMIDITGPKHVEAVLRESEEQFRALVEGAPDAILLANPETGKILDANKAASRLLARTREEIVALHQHELHPRRTEKFSTDTFARHVGESNAFGFTHPIENSVLRPDGTEVPVEILAQIVRVRGQAMLMGTFRDITERKRAEQALHESEQRFRNLVRDIPAVGVQGYAMDGTTRYWNMASEKIYGYTAQEAVGRNLLDLIIPTEMQADVRCAMQHMAATGQPIPASELSLIRKDGSTVEVFSSHAIVQVPGQEAELFCLDLDISTRKQAERALQESEANYSLLFKSMLDGFALHEIICDDTGRPVDYRFISVNPAFERLTGLRATDVIGRTVLEVMPGTEPAWIERYGRVALTGEGIEFEDYSGVLQRHFQITAFCYKPGQFATVFIDITARKQAEASLRASAETYRSILNASPDDITITDLEGRIFMVSPAALSMFGIGAEEVAQRHSILEFIVPEDRARALATLAQKSQGVKTGPTEYRGLHRDGHVFDIEVNSEFIQDAEGKPSSIVFVVRDVTERKRADNLIRASLREKESLLKEVHHRVKNNLQVISSLLRLEAGRSEHGATKSVLQEMQGRIRSMALLHETLYRTDNFGEIDLAFYFKQLAAQVFRSLGSRSGAIALQLNLTPVQMEIDRAIPCGLIANELLSNSLKHGFPDGGTGEVRIELQPVEGERRFRLVVSDTGVGLPADFELRQTQSLGLQLVSDLVGQIDGTLEIGRGPGAVFSVTFNSVAVAPVADKRPSPPSQHPFPAS